MIKKIITKYFDVVPLFRYKDIELKERLSLIFFIAGFFLAIVAFLTTFFLGMGLWLNIPNLLIIAMCVFLPFLFPNDFTVLGTRVLYFVAYIYMPITYFINGGHNGVGVLFFLMMVIYSAFFFEGKRLVYTLVSLMVVYSGSILVGYYYPSLIIFYSDELTKVTDTIMSMIMVSVVLSIISNSIFRSYNFEKNHVYQLMNELEERNVKLETLSNTDQLTEVYNRRFFMEKLQIAFDDYFESRMNFYVMMIDLDDFKRINDSNGHLYGDEILKLVANGIQSCLREHDIVSRYGGEEFSVIIAHSNEENGIIIAERIRNTIEKLKYRNEYCVTVSIGIVKNSDSDSLLGILKRADDFLYLAKDKGKNRVEGEGVQN